MEIISAVEQGMVRAWLQEQLPVELEWLQQMVAINSFTNHAAGVNELAVLTARAFAPLGLSPYQVPSDHPQHGAHLVLRREGGVGRRIGLITHLDTVFPAEEEQANQFRWQVEGDRIYGPGTHDIKGGTIMIRLVLRALEKFFPAEFASIDWIVLADAHEEQLAEDFGQLCRDVLGPDPLGCLIFEGGARQGILFSLVVARKGRFEFRVSAQGRAAHAGGAHQVGVNAITQLARTLPVIASLTDPARDLTVNVGTIQGGTVTNRVPHQAEAQGEARAFDKASLEQARDTLLSLGHLESAGIARERSLQDGFPAQVVVEILHQSPAWPRNSGTDHLYGRWARAAAELGFSTVAEHRGGLSDGNYLAPDLPTLDGLGPSGGNDHCSERSADGSKLPEYVEISSFVPKALLNVAALVRLIREDT